MTKNRTIKVSALNIAMHKPHSSRRYIDLLEKVYQLRLHVKMGMYGMIIGSLKPTLSNNSEFGVSGELFKFIKLNPKEPWFNAETQTEATEDEVNEIKIPNHLLPHLRRIPFTFIADKHQLWFISQDRDARLSAKTAESFFKKIFDNELITEEFPEIAVTALPDSDEVDAMLTLGSLSKMVIELNRPNPDDGDDDELEFLGRLEKMKARSIKTEITSERNQTIKPDEDIKRLARVASKNGRVRVSGKNQEGTPYTKSTDDIPLTVPLLVSTERNDSVGTLRRYLNID